MKWSLSRYNLRELIVNVTSFQMYAKIKQRLSNIKKYFTQYYQRRFVTTYRTNMEH